MSKGKTKTTYLHREGIVSLETQPDYSFLYESSTVKTPKYNLGDRVVLGDGRVFRYGLCGDTFTSMKHGLKNFNLLVTEKDAIAVAAAIGAKYVDITFADTDGVGNDGVIAVDSLRGGYISFYRGTDRQQRGIIGNTARANGDTGNTRVYLDAALRVAINEDDDVEVMATPYSDLRISGGGGEWTSVMGMPNVMATVGQYFWLQTWGPIRITPAAAELGVAGYERSFFFDANGSLVSAQTAESTTRSYQLAGFLLERTDGAAGSAAPFINLQINP